MARLLAGRIARAIAVLVAVAVIVAVAYVAYPRADDGSGAPVQSPIGGATTPSASPTSTASAEPSDPVAASPTSAAEATPTPRASPAPSPTAADPVATLTNPDGPPASGLPPDGYSFFESLYALPTYASLWLDDNQRDVHVALTGDVDGAMEEVRDQVPAGVTVYFYIVEYTEAEACAVKDAIFEDRDKLMARGIYVYGAGCGSAYNRVHVAISPLSPEALAFMRARYEGPIDYEGGGSFALRPHTTPEVNEMALVAVRADEPLGLHTCGHRPFPSSALEASPIDLEAPGPEIRALRESLDIYAGIYGDLRSLDWIFAEHDVFGATFIADRGDTWLHAPVFADDDGSFVPGTIEHCDPRPLDQSDGGEAALYLDPAYSEPKPDDTEIHVLVEEQACSSASSPASRLLPATVSYTADSVRVEVRVRRVSGAASCPGNPRLPVTIVLPEPLGDRQLVGISEPEF